MSSSDVAIRVQNLSKCFEIYNTPHDRLKQFVIPRFQRFAGRKARQYFREFWALKDVSFEIKKGETVGIIGRNGSGKSTLLQIICGTLRPTAGEINVHGRVAALLELGAGFNPEFSGVENVYMAASLYGLNKEDVDRRFDAIAKFADIGEHIYQPVKTYSSGMYVRLAFAVIAHVDADILVIDEALAVGDAFFTQKCMRFLREFTERGTLLFVSHDAAAVISLCNNSILLCEGKVERVGTPKDVSEYYMALLNDKVANLDSEHATDTSKNGVLVGNDFGTLDAHIVSVSLLNLDGKQVSLVSGGETVILEVISRANVEFLEPIFGFLIRDRLGQVIFGENTISYSHNVKCVKKDQQVCVLFTFIMPTLQYGEYSISVAVGTGNQEHHINHHWVHDGLIFRCAPVKQCFGVFSVEMKSVNVTFASEG